VQDILAGQATPPTYRAAPDCVALPLLALRPAHFRGDHTSEAGTRYKADRCPCCQTDLVGVAEDVSAETHTANAVCTGPAGVLGALRGALRQDVLAALPGTQAVQAAAHAVLVPSQEAEISIHAQEAFVSSLMDPGELCRMPSPAMDAVQRLAAGFVALAAAHWLGRGPTLCTCQHAAAAERVAATCRCACADSGGAPGLPFPCSPATRSQPQLHADTPLTLFHFKLVI
jgi:hypothetical protein